MIYLDNIIFSLQKAGGISAVWANLIENLISRTQDLRMIEYEDAYGNFFRQNLNLQPDLIIRKPATGGILREFMSPRVVCDSPFIFHSSYFRTCPNPNAINVNTVHDFIYEQGKMTLKQKIRTGLDYRAIRKSDAIVCVSENTKLDLLKFLPDIDESKIRVIHNGVSEDFVRLPEIPYPEYGNHVLFLGGRQSYKNFSFVVKSLKDTDFSLLICGSPLSKAETEMLESNLRGRYRHILFPVGSELNRIYNSVFALAYPSSYEGFGIPVLEAQRAGCPVIAMNISSIPEIIGEDALLISSPDKDEFLARLSEIKNPQRRHSVVETGLDNAKRFSWKRMADEYYSLYINLLRPQS
ncbi:MAG: glycosyltransferase family 4 protein [Muribaculaceae bacterium]|nr:glycosyltransferase family 4 protein [Muribaculaceae bacterium]